MSEKAIAATVYYIALDDQHAQLAVLSQAEKNIITTVIHEGLDDTLTHDLVGTEPTPVLSTKNAEAIILLARKMGQIVACQVLEVEAYNAEAGYILRPCAGYGFLIHQQQVSGIGLEEVPELALPSDEACLAALETYSSTLVEEVAVDEQ